MNPDETRIVAGQGTVPTPSGSGQSAAGRIGAYRLVRLLGQGGMGEVWLAERADEAYSKQVAIKFISGFQGNREAIDWFRRERQALARLEHPNIARLLDGGETEDGRPFLVMEYVDGMAIDAWCEGKPLEAVLELFLQVCSAVEHAHRTLIVHRDIKPANVLVTAEGQSRLLDFGIAKEVDPLADTAERTTTQAYTLHFASPEQMEGGTITVASDIYSLGALLYRLLSGRVPHAGTSSALGQLQAIQSTQPQKPSRVVLDNRTLADGERRRLARRLHGDLDDIVLKCLRREPELRYGSARELSEDIERYRKHEPVLARKGSAAYRASRYLRRHWLAIGAAAAVLLTLGAGLLATHWQAQEAERQRGLAQKRFDLSRALVNDVLFDFQDRLATVPGTIDARRHLVGRTREYLRKIEVDAQGDAGLLSDLARAERRLADIAGNPNRPNLGDSRAASEHYQRALKLARRALALRPDDPEIRDSLSSILYSLGMFRYWQDDLAGAEKLFQEALPYAEQRLRLVPGEGSENDLGKILTGIGDVEFWSRKYEAALATYTRACAKPLARQSKDVRSLDAASGCRMRLAETLGELERYPEAEQEIAKALTILRPLFEASPDSVQLADDVGLALNKQGDIFLLSGKLADALVVLSESLAIARRQADADPRNARAARNLAMAHNKRGDANAGAERFDDAAADYQAARAIIQRLWTQDPANPEHERDFALSNHRLGLAMVDSGKATDAIPYFDEAIVIMARRWQKTPDQAWSRRDLAVALSDRLEAPGDPAQACAWRRQFRDLMAAMRDAGETSESDIEELEQAEAALKACPPAAG